MVGIINTAINKEDPFSEVKGYEAERIDIKPENTVEGRVQGIIDRNPKNVQSEVTRAKQAAGRKGLLNTSMAVGDAERARIDTATPIAMQDSSQFLQKDMSNQAASNRANEFTAGEANVAAQQERHGQQQLENIHTQTLADIKKSHSQAKTDRANERFSAGIAEDVATAKAEQDVIMENLDAANAEKLTRVQGEYNERIQASTSAANIYSAHSSNITEILNNPKIKVNQKQQLIAQETQLMENAFAVQDSISSIDLSNILTFSKGDTGGRGNFRPNIGANFGAGGF